MFEDVEEIRPAEGEGELHFYYDRKERIARAPEVVQRYYENPAAFKPVRGIRIFFTKQNRFILFALIFFVAFAWIYTAVNNTRSQVVLDGVIYNLSAFSYEDEVYITIKAKFKNGTGQRAFTANVFAVNSDNQIQEKLVVEGLADSTEEQSVRARVRDFDIKRIDVIIDSQKESKELSAYVAR